MTRSESDWLLDLTAEWISGKARAGYFFAMLVGLLNLTRILAPAYHSNHTGLSCERLWSPVGNTEANFLGSLGSGWIEVLIGAAGSDECFEPV